ncbi:hypothetical protein HT136_19330 [Novosphingobium profundi]|uniref:hypothetical protein n=1 Tax=Novosphingobium profundi TaxID=1774954 RepID=UPI001BD9EA97|nr:hypothetical protein [Novosphingobium profundi]MBT0670523.1 hypothetical protein [Novosphingobium profundi]
MGHEEFKFSLRLKVEQPRLLWQSAARVCLEDPTLSDEDLEDLIGPREDPSIDDCLMILALSQPFPGCSRLDASLDDLAPAMRSLAAGIPSSVMNALHAS